MVGLLYRNPESASGRLQPSAFLAGRRPVHHLDVAGQPINVQGSTKPTARPAREDLSPALPPAALGLLAVGSLGVVLRRTKPWLAYALVLLASIGGLVTNASFFGSLLAEFVVLYTVSERSDLVVSLLALIAGFVAHYLALVRTGTGPADIPSLFLVDFAWIALAWFGGR
jgi:hypothetical protein